MDSDIFLRESVGKLYCISNILGKEDKTKNGEMGRVKREVENYSIHLGQTVL